MEDKEGRKTATNQEREAGGRERERERKCLKKKNEHVSDSPPTIPRL